MQAFKVKTKSKPVTEENPMNKFDEGPQDGVARLQAIYYSSRNLSQRLIIYDGDGDFCLYPIPGQESEKVIPLAIPITVKLPLYYIDEAGENNDIIIFGELLA